MLLNANTDTPMEYNNPVNNLFPEFRKKEDNTKTLADKQNERIDLEVKTIRNIRKEMSKEDNQMLSDEQLLDMLANSTLDDDMLIF